MTVLSFSRPQSLPQRPVLRVMLRTAPTTPNAQKIWVLGEARLLSQRKVHHFQVNINKPLILIITNFLQHILHRFILLLRCSRVSDGYRRRLVAVMLRNTFQWSFAAVNEQSPIFGFVLWHSKLEQKLHNICTVHQVLHCRRKKRSTIDACFGRSWCEHCKRGVFFLLQSEYQQFGRVR